MMLENDIGSDDDDDQETLSGYAQLFNKNFSIKLGNELTVTCLGPVH